MTPTLRRSSHRKGARKDETGRYPCQALSGAAGLRAAFVASDTPPADPYPRNRAGEAEQRENPDDNIAHRPVLQQEIGIPAMEQIIEPTIDAVAPAHRPKHLA